MKPFLLSLLLSISLFAEASFDQVQKLINNKQYGIAAASLEIIIQNHPQSSKAYYTLAQSYAGLGKLTEANQALAKAQAINPTLSFVPASDVASLKQAITPQTQLIKAVEPESHTALYIFLTILAGAIFYGYYRLRPKPEAEPVVTPEPTKAYEPYVYKEPKPYEPVYTRPSQSTTTVHHHHSDNTMSTIATAAVTAAAVSMLMDDDKPTHSYQPDLSSYQDDSRSATWEEVPTKSSSWDEPKSSSSSSWDEPESTRSSSSSWSDSSSSSSSSSDSSWSE